MFKLFANFIFASSLFLGISVSSFAQTAHQPASKASVIQLLEIMNSEKMMKEVSQQMLPMSERMIDSMQEQSDKPLTATQKQQLKELNNKVLKMIFEELSWNNLKDDIAQIYMDNLTQEEVNGLIQFYQSPVGQSTLNKMPQIMNQTMLVTSNKAMQIMPKIQAEVEQILEKN